MINNNILTSSYIPHEYIPRFNSGGNYCGHFPDSPKLNLPFCPKNLPQVLMNFNERFKAFFVRPALFPSLNYANGSKKQMSSARREACILLMSSISRHTELSSMRVGFPSLEGFVHLTVNVLAKHAGISISRAKRALKDLHRGGFLSLHRRYDLDKETGRYKGLASVKKLNIDVFSLLGLKKQLIKARGLAYTRLKKQENKEKKITVADQMRTKILFKGISQTTKNNSSKSLYNAFSARKNNNSSTRQKVTAVFFEDNPNASDDEIKNFIKALKEKYPNPNSK